MLPLLTRRHFSVFRAIPAAAGLIALTAGLAACTSSPAPPKPAGTASGIATITARLNGAGSTFDAPFFNLAFAAYQQSHPGVAASYAAVGSSAGITRFTAGQADFGATDVPASAADLAGARGGTAVQVPVDLGAVSVAYNVLTRTSAPLKLTGPVLAEIFLGQVTKWNDPAITALNPGADLPDVHITVVHRSDGSGTSYIFSDYLSAVSPAWAKAVGAGRTLKWPVGYAAKGNPGVVTAIDHISYSIGYVERSYTAGTELGAAAIRNQAGNYVTPTTAAIAADAAARPAITPASFSIVNQPGPAAYPICGYSWVLISARQQSTATGQALTGLISWLTHAGQSYAATLGYAPLPPAIQQLAATTLARVTGPDGQPLTG
ncbi:MAG TPA: phosphate ABC transporter substrate-binding protein PstS [Trebonia sp.]|nr:phosphate ABC transporter substrate-binding protein PstS [Trebonia sp.]